MTSGEQGGSVPGSTPRSIPRSITRRLSTLDHRPNLGLLLAECATVLAVAYMLGTSSLLVGIAVAGVAVMLVVALSPNAALLALAVLYVIPETVSIGGLRSRDVVAVAFGILVLEWLRRSVASRGLMLLLAVDIGLLCVLLVSALGFISQPGETASLAELGASLVILAAGGCLGAMKGMDVAVRMVRLVILGVAIGTLSVWLHNNASLKEVGALAEQARATSIFGNPNFLGTFLAIGAVLWIAPGKGRRPTLRQVVAFGVILAAVVVTASRGAILVTAIGLMAIMMLRRRRAVAVVAGVLLVPLALWGVFALTNARLAGSRQLGINAVSIQNSAGLRTQSARLALRLILQHPWAGVGYEQFVAYSARDQHIGIPFDTHDEYLRIGAEGGLTALAFFLILVLYPVWRAGREARNTGSRTSVAVFGALVAFAASLVTVNGLQSFQYAAPWMLLAGIMVGAAAHDSDHPPDWEITQLDRRPTAQVPARPVDLRLSAR